MAVMVALWRDESGHLRAWRVGRRRLAWRPRFPQRAALQGADGGPFEIIVFAIVLVLGLVHLLNWLAALLATSVVWPYRAVFGRWPVVAYPLDSSLVSTDDEGGDRPHRRRVAGRAAAVALTQQWVRNIERQGHPEEGEQPAAPDRSASLS
ncbi:hypothetical protein LUPAC06_06305 [Micromonospora saelicesensis]|uniref:hypothetical protein n=1 Tax=Micromonospora saelicesensis TaxID=285676 RepID=UPI000DC02B5E|nr:hypothetical protein [Micromonospora saelicesensis]RAO51620.1 hypothetical protein LUPAC06_06305 [Micromonospora saelicesensis]